MPKSALAIRHVAFEDVGTFAEVLDEAGYTLGYHDVGVADFSTLDPLAPDLLIVLGGPIGVYEEEAYPFLPAEKALITSRLESGRPVLGLCLGAQLMAAALGAKVAPTGLKEIGFAPLTLTDAGLRSPLRHLEGISVVHWHGDAFETPRGADHLAFTEVCPSQAFAIGKNVLGLQFHPEADASKGLESWLIGHACELAGAGIDPRAVRAQAMRLGPVLKTAGQNMFREWLGQLEPKV